MKKMKKQLKLYTLAGLLSLCVLGTITSSFAKNFEKIEKIEKNITIGRYLSVAEKPQNGQQRLLQQQIQIKFPQDVLTIQQAIEFVLRFSGYHLANLKQMNQPARNMSNQPLPIIDKTFGPMTLEQGLITLAGNEFYLLIDPVHRLVSFQVKPSYRRLYNKFI